MSTISITIDRLYDLIVKISTSAISNVYETFSPMSPPPVLLPTEEKEEEVSQSFKTIDEVLRAKLAVEPEVETSVQEKPQQVDAAKNMVMYTSSTDVPVYANATIEFDTKIASIPYGEMVMMLDTKGRFHKVVWNHISGWVLKEDVVDRAAHIQPSLVIGEENQSDHTNTIHIRAMLNDMFGVGRADFPLQAGEYVLFKLWEKDHHIEWPETRPRTPGVWHKILRGVPNVHIGVMPKVGSIMEYVHDDAFGHVSHVDAVFPDETITISEANFPDSGKYNERTLTKNEWKELRPVFIHVQ